MKVREREKRTVISDVGRPWRSARKPVSWMLPDRPLNCARAATCDYGESKRREGLANRFTWALKFAQICKSQLQGEGKWERVITFWVVSSDLYCIQTFNIGRKEFTSRTYIFFRTIHHTPTFSYTIFPTVIHGLFRISWFPNNILDYEKKKRKPSIFRSEEPFVSVFTASLLNLTGRPQSWFYTQIGIA